MPTIRFVGGPWHNRLESVELIPQIVIRKHSPPTLSYAGVFANAIQDRYYLAKYFTEWGTNYMQYVHSSLIQGDKAAPSTHRERFPAWVINKRQLDARLKNAITYQRQHPQGSG